MNHGLLPPGHRTSAAHRYRETNESHVDLVEDTGSFDGFTDHHDNPDFSDSWQSDQGYQLTGDWDTPITEDDHRPGYHFRTASGERLEFSYDGARVDNSWAASEPEPMSGPDPRRSTDAGPRRSGGAHRLPAPPTALKGRAAVVAVAAGAVVAAGQAGMESSGNDATTTVADYQAAGKVHEIANQSVSIVDTAAAVNAQSPQVLNASSPLDLSQFDDILQKGQKYAADVAAAEAAKLRPLFTRFTNGNFTSGYGARWGVQHLGVDVAAPIGTPIYAVADGTVLEAGPAAGFGMWVRLLHDDGTVTIYGHVDTTTVSHGQQVMAGDQIATVGNRGFSTGPHCHFEVWLNGTDKVDPLPWLASRGISLGPQRD